MVLYPNGAAMILANLIRTELAASEMKLFQAIASPLSPSTVVGDLTEADFTGYAAIAIANWLPAYLDPNGGASIQSGTQQFNVSGPVLVTNVILGFYIETAGGDLLVAGTFAAPIAMANIGDALPNNVTLNFGAPIS